MRKILSLQHIFAGYEGSVVLNQVSLDVYQNDFIGIIGPNGGGKTTLIKLILGLLKPFSGTIEYHFKDNNKPVIGYLPQQNNLDKKFPISVREVVLSGLMSTRDFFYSYKKPDFERTDQILDLFGIGDLATRAVGELSGGQMQRTLLARAVIASPELLILDEPDSFVDNRFEQELYEILKELNNDMAILLISHDLGTISSYIKSIACVNGDLHYHNSNRISNEQLKIYNCPIDIISHGTIPHRVLHSHEK